LGGGQGLRFSGGALNNWSDGIDVGIQNAASGYDRSTDFAAGPPRPGMKFTDSGWQNADGIVSVGGNGEPTAFLSLLFSPINPTNPLNPLNPVTGGFTGGKRPEQPTGAPGYDPVTDMPSGTPGFPGQKLPTWMSTPPSLHDANEFLGKGLGTVFPIAKPMIDILMLKLPSEILGENLEAAGYTRPDGSAAHHIVPYGDRRAQNIRDQLNTLGIKDLNLADNGVFLPQVSGSTAPGAYHPSLNSDLYIDQLRIDFQGVTSRQRALDTLKDIRQQLLNGTYPGSKPVPPKKP
jgi:hypothetical protein